MEDADFTDDFCRFVQTTIPSVETAELLIVLARAPQTDFTPDEAQQRLPAGAPVRAPQVATMLEMLQTKGLVSGNGRAYRFAPTNETLRAHAQTLAQAYDQRPVTLIRIIYALRDSRIQSFAEAFRLRKR